MKSHGQTSLLVYERNYWISRTQSNSWFVTKNQVVPMKLCVRNWLDKLNFDHYYPALKLPSKIFKRHNWMTLFVTLRVCKTPHICVFKLISTWARGHHCTIPGGYRITIVIWPGGKRRKWENCRHRQVAFSQVKLQGCIQCCNKFSELYYASWREGGALLDLKMHSIEKQKW